MTGLEWAIMVFFMGRTLLEIQQLRAIYIDMKRYKQRELKMGQRLKESFKVYTRWEILNGTWIILKYCFNLRSFVVWLTVIFKFPLAEFSVCQSESHVVWSKHLPFTISDETNQSLRSTTYEGTTEKNKSIAPEANHTQQVKLRKNGQRKHATCFVTLLQNVLKSDVARFTTHVQICFATN